MSDIFESNDTSFVNDTLNKALVAGTGADAAAYTGGRALQREDLEATMVSVLDVKQRDLKLFSKMSRTIESSSVHQVNRMVGAGNHDFLFVGEGESPSIDDVQLERKIYESKYIASEWQVSDQLTRTNTVQNPINAQKVAATLRVLKGTEGCIIHGDSSINPKQYDGLLKILKDSANNTSVDAKRRARRYDLRGLEIAENDTTLGVDAREVLFDKIASDIYGNGGDAAEAYFPPVLAQQFRNLYNDRLRYNATDTQIGLNGLPDISTAIGSTIKIKDDCGADKMFNVKGRVAASGSGAKRPNTPTSITASATTDSASNFTSGFAGTYIYGVHAVNAYGVSAAATLAVGVAVSAGDKVTLTITPDTNGNDATGFIITRTNANGTDLMEMVRIPRTAGSTITYVDYNNDLPGTASMVVLSPDTDEMIPNSTFAQLMELSNFDLPTNSALIHHGVVALYGNYELRAPEYCALVENIGYEGGLY